jgi:hypothetical protein
MFNFRILESEDQIHGESEDPPTEGARSDGFDYETHQKFGFPATTDRDYGISKENPAPAEVDMTRLSSAALAFFLFASPCTYAAGDSTRPADAHAKGVNLSGKVSDDGKLFVADDENNWSVINLDSLKGLEGRYVVVKCRMDVSKQAIRVLSVEEPSPSKHTAHLGDAAFRR